MPSIGSLLRAINPLVASGLRGNRLGQEDAARRAEAERQRQQEEEDRRRQREMDALQREILGFNLEGNKATRAAQAAQAARDAQELAALRGMDPSFANQSRENIERILAERAQPSAPKLVTDRSGRRVEDQVGVEVEPPGPKGPSAAMQSRLLENQRQLSVIDNALEGLARNPGAVGLKNYLPDVITNRTDAAGVPVRADIADIGSLIVHTRSGTAVSVKEEPRLRPFVPSDKDPPDVVQAKLVRLKQLIEEENSAMGSDSAGADRPGPASRPDPRRFLR